MNLYRFVTSFCLFPVTDIIAVGQRVLSAIQKSAIIAGIIKAVAVIKSVLAASLAITGWLVLIEQLGRKILGVIGIAGAVGSGSATVAQVFKLLESIGDPQTALLDYIHSVMVHIPYSISSLLSGIDSTVSSITSAAGFSPAVTFTYILQVTAVGECFNQLIMAAVQNAIFIFSVYLVRWAFRQNFTFVKQVPGNP